MSEKDNEKKRGWREFLPWLLALFLFIGIESYIYTSRHPTIEERSDFLVFPTKRLFQLLAERWVIYTKFTSLEQDKPVAIHAGDSSGFFGLMPEVIEEYIDRKVLNFSCCANQGFHGYLAALELGLNKNPGIKYAIVNMAPNVHPRPDLWRGAKDLNISQTLQMSVMGDDMERNFVSPLRYLYPPSNALRPDFTNTVMQLSTGPMAPVVMNNYRTFGVFDSRNGYMFEHDIIVGQNCAMTLPKHPDGRTYLEHFVEDFVDLGQRFNVTPVLFFHPTNCPTDQGHRDFQAELERLKQKYPTLKVPYFINEQWPWNWFSVPAHVQHGVAIETSRRFGRMLRELMRADGLLAPSTVEAEKALAAAPPPKLGGPIRILGAVKQEVCDYYGEFQTPYYGDVTKLFSDQCDGKTSCSYAKGSSPLDIEPPRGCMPIYHVTYQCEGGPVRNIREERNNSFGGAFNIDCAATASLEADPMPYGIQVDSATYGGNVGVPFGNVSFFAKARCDGLSECPFSIDPARFSDPAPGRPKTIAVSYRCGRESDVRTAVTRPSEGTAMLSCREPLDPTGIQIVDASYGRSLGAAPGNATASARWACDGRRACDYLIDVEALGDPAPGKPKDFELLYRCGAGPVRRGEPPASANGYGLGEVVRLSCADAAGAPPADRMTVLSARYGSDGAPQDNALYPVLAACEGKQQCSVLLPSPLAQAVKPGEAAFLEVSLRCARGGEKTFRLPATVGDGSAVNLSCADTPSNSDEASLRQGMTQ